jgi:hypothetical protein
MTTINTDALQQVMGGGADEDCYDDGARLCAGAYMAAGGGPAGRKAADACMHEKRAQIKSKACLRWIK